MAARRAAECYSMSGPEPESRGTCSRRPLRDGDRGERSGDTSAGGWFCPPQSAGDIYTVHTLSTHYLHTSQCYGRWGQVKQFAGIPGRNNIICNFQIDFHQKSIKGCKNTCCCLEKSDLILPNLHKGQKYNNRRSSSDFSAVQCRGQTNFLCFFKASLIGDSMTQR